MFVHNQSSQCRALRRYVKFSLGIFLFCLSWGGVLAQSVTIDEGETMGQVTASNADDVVINKGVIGTTNTGISSSGVRATIANEETGTIETSGDDSIGIFTTGDNTVIRNSGTITANGVHSEGIYSDALNAMIRNIGTITATGEAISVHGDDARITVSGRVSATGEDSYAVRGFDGEIRR